MRDLICGLSMSATACSSTITDDKNTVGDALTATPGTWSSSTSVTYGYQWQRCGYAATILADHPVGYWPLDEAAGPKGDDASGNNNGGTYQGTPVFGVPGALADSQGTAVRTGNGAVQGCGRTSRSHRWTCASIRVIASNRAVFTSNNLRSA